MSRFSDCRHGRTEESDDWGRVEECTKLHYRAETWEDQVKLARMCAKCMYYEPREESDG